MTALRPRSTFPDTTMTLDDGASQSPSVDALTPGHAEDGSFPFVIGGRYLATARLGAGGFSEVLLAHGRCPDEVERWVALKRLHRPMRQARTAVARLQREAKLLRKLNHPGLPRLFDALPSEYAVVLERAPGEHLSRMLDGSFCERLSTIRAVFLGLLDVLSYLHAHGVCHRDLKPSNILVDWESELPPHVTLLDLGLAASIESESPRTKSGGSITRSGIPIGSPRYMSPEQCKGRQICRESDVYSVGVMLYEALCGRHPFPRPTARDYLLAHSLAEPQPASFPCREKTALLELALHALAKEPSQRPTLSALRAGLS